MSGTVEVSNGGAGTPLMAGLEQYYMANGPGFGEADILCCGSSQAGERTRILIQALFRHNRGESPISRILIVLSPTDKNADTVEDQSRAMDETVRSGRQIQTARSADLRMKTLIAILRSVEPHTVVIVRQAAQYRDEHVRPYIAPGPLLIGLDEDLWVPALHVLATAVTQVAHSNQIFVILDAGEFYPHRQVLVNMLESVEHCGVLGAKIEPGLCTRLALRAAPRSADVTRS